MGQSEYKLNLPARAENDDDPVVAGTLGKIKSKYGFLPNLYARMVNVPALVDTYLTANNAFQEDSGFSPAEQQIVLLTISRFNRCNYCVAVHSTLADGAKVPTEVTDALRAGDPLPDERLDALATFTTTLLESRGLPSRADVEAFLAAGYQETDVLQIVLAIAFKTISNYSNHLFHTPVDDVFQARAWEG